MGVFLVLRDIAGQTGGTSCIRVRSPAQAEQIIIGGD
ncbi:hypothetical protein SKA53_09469 [Yoonia vestfoldensis SKA53]|uniref:Uncharacterized protein n=1 Tax=Yoonia vestfoldensis SKA53 TaxID=314232 RepID=A3V1J0_9RHOB|nr:hypothetical protein SKA53_09469 [Yoonia vestfoldensis SKA53]